MDLIESTGYERLPEVCHIDIDREDFEVGLLALLRIISIIGIEICIDRNVVKLVLFRMVAWF